MLMHRLTACLWGLFVSYAVFGQITLEECQRRAREHYPLIRQYELIDRTLHLNLANLGKAYLPQPSLTLQASYQSDVTWIPVSMPGVSVAKPYKDQYKAQAQIDQLIWDGGNIRNRKAMARSASAADSRQLDSDLYRITERVNDLYFGILLLEEQISQNGVLRADLEYNREKVENYIRFGTATPTDLDEITVSLLNAEQQLASLKSSETAYREMLGLLTGTDISGRLLKPALILPTGNGSNRPEMKLIEARETQLRRQRDLLRSGLRPTIGLFVQGGYGRPGLNMLETRFEGYYMAGIRIAWNFGSFYTYSDSRKLLDTDGLNLDINRSVFLLNTSLDLTARNRELDKYRELLKSDNEIVRLRSGIVKSSEIRLANGTITVTDLLLDIDREHDARCQRSYHEIQALYSLYKLKYLTNE